MEISYLIKALPKKSRIEVLSLVEDAHKSLMDCEEIEVTHLYNELKRVIRKEV